MDAKTKKKVVIATSILVILGVSGYLVYDYLKGKPKKSNKSVPSTSESLPMTDAIASEYRKWANSTDDLSVKYGKKSPFDLDAVRSSDPSGGTFWRSYEQGKAEFQASRKK